MNILVATNHLQTTGGTESYTYALIVELIKKGHHVEYFTFEKGEVSDIIENLGVKFRKKIFYDLILANHYNVVDHLHKRGFIIQTCHGICNELEKPSPKADAYVAISYEVQEYLLKQGIKSSLILNGIDCNRFTSKRDLFPKLNTVLSLCQSEEANKTIQKACTAINVDFIKANKYIENTWFIEDIINKADLVIGIGRSLYDAMACGRAIISYDSRSYSKSLGDGYLNNENIHQSLRYNCSGRYSQKEYSFQDLISEMNKYNFADGQYFRDFSLQNLNIEIVTQKYIFIFLSRKKWFLRIIKMIALIKHNSYWSYKVILSKINKLNIFN
ncbi:MAG TPA: glycosyltransferase family 4 protein [Acholeplasmataceae bacterium]|nr:glycosyltransferase family 4 protein [Acholeplasmataceae bacterium]